MHANAPSSVSPWLNGHSGQPEYNSHSFENNQTRPHNSRSSIDRNTRQRSSLGATGKEALRALIRFPRSTSSSEFAPKSGKRQQRQRPSSRCSADVDFSGEWCVFQQASVYSSTAFTSVQSSPSQQHPEERRRAGDRHSIAGDHYDWPPPVHNAVLTHIAFGTTIGARRNRDPVNVPPSSSRRSSWADTGGSSGGIRKMLNRGPRGTVDVMPAELVSRIEGRKEVISLGSAKRSSTGGVDQFHTLQMKRGKSEEDLGNASTLPKPSPVTSPIQGGASPSKSRFRRRSATQSSASKLHKSPSGGLDISMVPGSFRKVAGVREDRTDGGEQGGERLRTVEIDLGEKKDQPLGFEFDLRNYPTLNVHEARVTDVESGSMVDTQHLLQIGDILTKVNGMDVAMINNREDLLLLMRSKQRLTLSLKISGHNGSAAGRMPRPATADGFFTTPEPPVKNKSESTDHLRVDTIAKFQPADLDPQDAECAYDEIELYPEKKDPKKEKAKMKSDDDDVENWEFRSKRDSVGLVELMEEVVDVMLNKDLTGEERRQQLHKHGVDINLPSLAEEEDVETPTEPQVRTMPNVTSLQTTASPVANTSRAPVASVTPTAAPKPDLGHNKDEETVSLSRESAPVVVDQLSASSRSLTASHEDSTADSDGDAGGDSSMDNIESMPPTGELSASSRSRIDSLRSLSGILSVNILDGGGFIPPSGLRCVIVADGQFSVETSHSPVQPDGRVSWDDDFQMDLDDNRSLVVSCFASTGGHRDALSGRTTIQLETLVGASGKRKLQLTLAPRGRVRLDLSFTERVRLLKRFPSEDEYFNVFGIDLYDLTSRERRPIPWIATKCIEEIDRRGLKVPGIYRVAGSMKLKKELRDNFEDDSSRVSMLPDDVPDVTVIASLLKDFLCELPEPLLTNDFCVPLVRAARRTASDEVRQQRLFDILQHLPESNLDLARMLFRHFHKLLESLSSNKLTPRGLSICLGPALLCPAPPARGTEMEAIDFEGMSDVVEAMLQYGWPDNAFTNEETTF